MPIALQAVLHNPQLSHQQSLRGTAEAATFGDRYEVPKTPAVKHISILEPPPGMPGIHPLRCRSWFVRDAVAPRPGRPVPDRPRTRGPW